MNTSYWTESKIEMEGDKKESQNYATPPGRNAATSVEGNSASCRPLEPHDVISPAFRIGSQRQLEGSVASDFDTCPLQPDTFSSPMLPQRDKELLVLDSSPLPTPEAHASSSCFSPQKFPGDVCARSVELKKDE